MASIIIENGGHGNGENAAQYQWRINGVMANLNGVFNIVLAQYVMAKISAAIVSMAYHQRNGNENENDSKSKYYVMAYEMAQ